MTVFFDNDVVFVYNHQKDLEFTQKYCPFGDSVGIQDVIVNGEPLQEGDPIYVRDSRESEWIPARFAYAHDYEVYATTEATTSETSWRYVAINKTEV